MTDILDDWTGPCERAVANAILRVAAVREASWNGERCTRSWADAAEAVPMRPAFRSLVAAMLRSDVSDFTAWATRHGSVDVLVASNRAMLNRL